ncbi:FMN-linked oxidoreductase [Tothia fuscella]|uniref:Dihydroorotate dehydrogenase (fumarate) n=1 Tax=Tothia fuscella TaxID=1048955 RepID=A0A9P4TYF3_9PEZI|nr:FMN-linked oxidoreductase [Tothia fuscella]
MTLKINPPLINSSNPWATTLSDLRKLYLCQYTGAVTVRTSTLSGFAHNDSIHQYTFFDPHTFDCIHSREGECQKASASLNTLGYSPIPLAQTLENIRILCEEDNGGRRDKSFLVSVTGTPGELRECYRLILEAQRGIEVPLYMEVNLSCPNISGKPPPAHDLEALLEYLTSLNEVSRANNGRILIGIKTPPYTNPENFDIVKSVLMAFEKVPISFITATNTLGSCLLLDNSFSPALSSADEMGIGGMAGTPLHPLALGNVKLLRKMFDSEEKLKEVTVIGIGGVSDRAGFERMMSVGAEVVGVGTALGRVGVRVFEEITNG